MKEIRIKYGVHGKELFSRPHSREICFSQLNSNCNNSLIVLDFNEVEVITTSFATELVKCLQEKEINRIQVIDANSFISNTIKFACRRLKFPMFKPEIETA